MTIGNEEKMQQLADYLKIDVKEIEQDGYDENFFMTPEGSFTVMSAEEAKTEHLEYEKNLLADVGIDEYIKGCSESFQKDIYTHYIEDTPFEKITLESNRIYAQDIKEESSDEYANRLVEECVERGVIGEDELDGNKDFKGDYTDLAEQYAEHLTKETGESYTSFAEYVVEEFGDETFKAVYKDNPDILDIEAISEAIADEDGYGNALAGWDCETNEVNGIYMFKQTDSDDRTQEFLDELENNDIEYGD